MSSLIQKIAKLAIKNLSRDNINPKKLNADLEHIKALVNKITLADLNIDPRLLKDTGPFDVS